MILVYGLIENGEIKRLKESFHKWSPEDLKFFLKSNFEDDYYLLERRQAPQHTFIETDSCVMLKVKDNEGTKTLFYYKLASADEMARLIENYKEGKKQG